MAKPIFAEGIYVLSNSLLMDVKFLEFDQHSGKPTNETFPSKL